MQGKVYVNGTIVAPNEARVSVFDRGFLYGDSVFETLRVYRGTPFALQAHLARLFASGERVGFALPWTTEFLAAAIAQTVAATCLHDAYVRLIATRGTGPMNLDPSTAENPSLFVIASELPPLPEAMYKQGRTGWLVSVLRQGNRTVDPLAKTGNYLNSVLATREARLRGADEAIMLDAQGRIAEASAANVFALIDGVWCTPPLEVGILSGITRQTLLRLAAASEERILWPADLQRATEIFLCASIREIVPLVQLDGKPVGDGKVGPRTQEMTRLYHTEVLRPLS